MVVNPSGGSVSPLQSPGHLGIDGPCASKVRYPGAAVGAASVAEDCYERVAGVAGLRPPLRSPSPCLNLDTLSSDESAGPGDVSAESAHPICISDVSSHSGDPDQVLSDLPPEFWG